LFLKNILHASSKRKVGKNEKIERRVPRKLSWSQNRLTSLILDDDGGGGDYEADYLLPVSAKVKNNWIYTSTPPYVFMKYCLIS
jgi:hypothetical protein